MPRRRAARRSTAGAGLAVGRPRHGRAVHVGAAAGAPASAAGQPGQHAARRRPAAASGRRIRRPWPCRRRATGHQVRPPARGTRCRPASRRRSGSWSGWPGRTGAGAGRARAACAPGAGAASRSAAGARRSSASCPSAASRAAAARRTSGARCRGSSRPTTGGTGRAAPTSCADRAARRRRRRTACPRRSSRSRSAGRPSPIGSPNSAANGSAVCWARSSGLATTTVMSRPASACGRRLGHLLAQRGQPEPGQSPVQNLGGVVHLTVAQQVHDRGRRSCGRPAAAARAARPAAPPR